MISSATNNIGKLPYLGSGIGYRREIREEIFDARDKIDFVEILTDQFIEDPRGIDEVREVCGRFPVVPHGVGLSIGSATGLDREYLRKAKDISDVTGSPYYSEHLCMTRAPGIDIGHLSQLSFSKDTLARTIRNVQIVQDVLEKPLVLENVTYLVDIPNAEISQGDFFGRLVEVTGCGVLLDVTNVHINSVNHDFDAMKFIRAMPLEKVVQVHLAGGYWTRGVLVDSHSEAVSEESWEIFEALADMAWIRACIVERDANFPSDISSMLWQVDLARSIIAGADASRSR